MHSTEHRPAEIAKELSGLLADTYTLYNATQNCHWNVEGEHFKPLHDLFEEQYTELADAIDTIAERVRVLGFYTQGTLGEIINATRVRYDGSSADSTVMLDQLIAAHQVVLHRIQQLQQMAEKEVDEATMDLLVERQRVHEKAQWFLRSHTGEGSTRLEEVAVSAGMIGVAQ